MSRPHQLAAWLGPIAVAAVHFAAAYLSLQLTWWSSGLAAIWPANAVLLAALLIVPRSQRLRYAAVVWLGSVAANFAIRSEPIIPSVFAFSNVMECLIAAVLIGRGAPREPNLERTDALLRFGLASLVAATASASLSAPFMVLFRGLPFLQSWLSWFSSDLLGLLLVTPVLLIGRETILRLRRAAEPARIGEAALLFLLIGSASIAVFGQSNLPLLFALTPLVFVATFRLRSLGAATATIIVAIVGSWFTAAGSGPIALLDAGGTERIYLLQIYLAATFLTALPLAAVLAERDSLAAAAIANAEDAAVLAAEAQRIAATDELTGVASRRRLLHRLDDEIRASLGSGRPLSVALFDVDHFKRINDSLGHSAGDEVLRSLAQLAVTTVRQDDVVGRLGGEEFAIVMPGATVEQAAAVAERLRAASAQTHLLDGEFPPVTISVGVAALALGATAPELLRAADRALYEAKAQGRNRLALAA